MSLIIDDSEVKSCLFILQLNLKLFRTGSGDFGPEIVVSEVHFVPSRSAEDVWGLLRSIFVFLSSSHSPTLSLYA